MKVVLNFDLFFSLLTRQNCMFIPLLFPAILSKIDKIRPRINMLLRMISTKWLFISLSRAVLQLCGELLSCFAQSRLPSTFWSHLAVSVILESRFFALMFSNRPALSEREAKYVICFYFLLKFTLYIQTTWGCDYIFILKTIMSWLSTEFGLTTENRNSCR